jgi:Family of unknown function (DUF6508)
LSGTPEPERRYRLDALAAALPIVEAPDFEAGQWHDSEKRDDGVWTMPWYELSPAAESFLRAVGESGLMLTGFDWPSWAKTPEAVALHGDREVLAKATPDQLAMLLTALIRENRFNEGALGDSFESGIMTAIARRAKELAGPDA